jgi:positive regulator of sigma E activity
MFIKGIDQEQGEVVAVHDGSATIKIAAGKSCDRCKLCEKISSTEMVVEALTQIPLKEGEKVILSVKPGDIIKSAGILYIIPLFGLIVGYYFARFLDKSLTLGFSGELYPALISIVFLFLCFVPIRIYDTKRQKQKRLQVFVKERLSSS